MEGAAALGFETSVPQSKPFQRKPLHDLKKKKKKRESVLFYILKALKKMISLGTRQSVIQSTVGILQFPRLEAKEGRGKR